MSESFSGGDIASAMSASGDSADPGASPASDPSTTAAGVLPAEDAASQSQAVAADGTSGTTETDPLSTDPSKGAVPPETRWPKILENARTKATQETEAKFQWATNIREEHRATVGEFYKTLETAPVTAIESLILTAAADPTHAPQLRSLLGRLLGNRAPQERPAETRQSAKSGALPEPDFHQFDEQGREHQFYSASKMHELANAIEARIDAKYANELKPLKTDLQTRAQRAAQAQEQQAADRWAETRYAKVSQWPHFKAHEKAIAAAITNDPDLDVSDAYIEIVVPQLSQTERTSVVSSLRDKASASSINPGNPASAVNGSPKTFADAFAQLPATFR